MQINKDVKKHPMFNYLLLRTKWLLEFEWSSTPLYFNDTSYCNSFLYFHTLPFYTRTCFIYQTELVVIYTFMVLY